MRNFILVAVVGLFVGLLHIDRLLPAEPLGMPKVLKTSHRGGNGSATATPLWDANGFAWYLTAKHCLPVATVGGQEVVAEFPHPDLDLAVLQVRGAVGVGCRIASKLTPPGAKLLTIGYPRGEYLAFSDGRQGGPSVRRGNVPYRTMTCNMERGGSGGPVLNADGELVGIFVGAFRGRTDHGDGYLITFMTVYVPVVALKSWILSHTGV